MGRSWTRGRLPATVGAVALAAAACSGSNAVATVDDATIAEQQLTALHVDVDELDEDELAGSALLLVLHSAFSSRALNEFGIEADSASVTEKFSERTERFAARGDLDEQLALLNVKRQRYEIESELDVLQDEVGAYLVRTEAEGFDLDGAYEAYLIDNAEVCIKQIQVDDVDVVDTVIARLAAGEDFDPIAREVSTDPFVDREPGRVGAGGDLGCSAPAALPQGLAQATLTAPVGEPTGPVVSAVGVHVLLVYDRTAAALADVRGDVLEHAVPRQGEEMFRLWAVKVLQAIEVDVNESYGRWGIIPETDPVPTVVPAYRFDAIIEK